MSWIVCIIRCNWEMECGNLPFLLLMVHTALEMKFFHQESAPCVKCAQLTENDEPRNEKKNINNNNHEKYIRHITPLIIKANKQTYVVTLLPPIRVVLDHIFLQVFFIRSVLPHHIFFFCFCVKRTIFPLSVFFDISVIYYFKNYGLISLHFNRWWRAWIHQFAWNKIYKVIRNNGKECTYFKNDVHFLWTINTTSWWRRRRTWKLCFQTLHQRMRHQRSICSNVSM